MRNSRLSKRLFLRGVAILALGAGGMIVPARTRGQVKPPAGADCTIGRSNAEVHGNKTKSGLLVTVEVKNLGDCLVRTGTPSDFSKDPKTTGDVGGGKTEYFTFEEAPKGTNDEDGHALDVLVSACDDERRNCAYEVRVVSATPAP